MAHSRSVLVDELADAIAQELANYGEVAADDVKEAVRKAGETVKKDINDSAPVRTGKYAKSWKTKITSEDSQGMIVTVYSPTRYMLAHLLEHGHAKRGGGRTRAIPHIAPAEEHGEKQLLQDLGQALGT